MELELKHIATYAPYCIKGKLFDNIDVVTGLNFEHGIIETLNNNNCLLEDFKPILRPLSDLEKRIDDDENNLTYLAFLGCFTEMDKYYILDHDNIKYQQYYTITQLLEWNFDIFGLIKEGLAIDINTLKQTT